MRIATTLVLAASFAGIAHASDGALEINEACVATGCFPGDTGGYPVTITAPGSYRLTSNLAVATGTENAIRFDVQNVTLDLGGFVISGPIPCTGAPAVCTGASEFLAGFGVSAYPGHSVVRNGTIRGMGRAGIDAGPGMRIEAVLVQGNGVNGIAGDWGSDGWIVDRCIVRGNGGAGIQLNAGTGAGSVVMQSAIRENGGVGVQGTVFLANNSITGNNDYGSTSGAHLLGNVFTGNKAGGNTAQTNGANLLGNNWCGTDSTCP